MSGCEKNESVIYKCPMCFNNMNDVPIDKYPDGIYRCMKCGYNGDFDTLMKHYDAFRSRYKLMKTRITLEELRKM